VNTAGPPSSAHTARNGPSRWHGRLCAEARLTLTEAQLVVTALDV
jgi:hypothetical protein